MVGSLTCVRLLSTVSKTGAIMEKSVPGELSSWLDLRRFARSQHVQGTQKAGEGRLCPPQQTPLDTNHSFPFLVDRECWAVS